MTASPNALQESSGTYVYRCVDRSCLSAWIARRVAPPVERWLPPAWSANAITALGAGLVWVLLAGVLAVPATWRAGLAPLWVALLWGYCVLDHVDGCRARRLRSSSAWGEFLDHGLDAWHASMVVIVAAVVSSAAVRPWLAVATVAATGLATVATWLEQRWRGELFLDQIGPVEGVLVVGIYLATWTWPGAGEWWMAPVSDGAVLSRAECMFVIGAGGALASAVLAVARTPGGVWHLSGFGGSALALAASVPAGAPGAVVVAALGLSTADAATRIIASHLGREACPRPDFVGAGLVWLGLGLPTVATGWFTASLIWLVARAAGGWFGAARLRRSRVAGQVAGISNELGVGK